MKSTKIDFSRFHETVNSCFYRYLYDYRRFQVYKGGAGSGKSVWLSQKILYSLIVNKVFNVLVVRKIAATNHESTYPEIKKRITEWGWLDLFEMVGSKGSETITFIPNGNRIVFKGLDDVNKLKSITFNTGDLTAIWIEEADEISLDDFNQLNLRLRGRSKLPKHIMLSFNPIDTDSWLKKRFFDEMLDQGKGYVCESTYKDNRFLDPEYKAQLEGLQNVDWYYYQVYALNQWGNRHGTSVFNNLKIHDFPVDETKMKNRRHGMDFGYNDPTVYMSTGFIDGEMYVYDEIYKTRLLTSQFIEAMEQQRIPKDGQIIADSAETDRIMEIRQAGFRIYPSKKGAGSVKRRIDWLKSLPAIHIHQSRCPNAVREFRGFKYRQTKDGRVLDETIGLDDHTIDAVGYGNEDLITTKERKHYFMKGVA